MAQGGVQHADSDEAIRADTYRLLSRLLARAPDESLLAALATAAAPGNGPVGAAWSALGEAAAAADPDSVDDEFHTLFIGLGRGEVVPYASWYLTGFLMGRPLVALRSRLAALGFERQDGVSEPEDHVSALFDVMGALADPVERAELDTQRRFFAEFLAPWAERFMTDVQHSGSAEFYGAVAGLGQRFVVLEKQYLGLAEGTSTVESPAPGSGDR